MHGQDTFVRIAPFRCEEGARSVRIFVSSTFGDMQAERNALVKVAFSQLQKRCTKRDVEFSYVDLRWGITGDQVADGRVLSICLDEIERCRPYFIGLLGDYYGSLPRVVPACLRKRYPWLTDAGTSSVTEIEMTAVLKRPRHSGHAHFFLRSPLSASLAESPDRKVWVSTGDAARKLQRLKDAIRDCGLPLLQYRSPEDLAAQVVERIWASVEQDFPPLDYSNSREREAALHTAHVAQHARVFVGRRSSMDRLSEHLVDDGPPLVVSGPTGSGKTALVAAWIAERQSEFASMPMVLHSAQAAPDANQWPGLLRRIARDLGEATGVSAAVPEASPHELLLWFPGFLREVAGKARVLILVDGADQLRGPAGYADWAWIPVELPPQVRILATARPGPALREMSARGWSELPVEPLGRELQRALITVYLGREGRTLEDSDLDQILASTAAKHALFLRVLLGELRAVGTWAELSRQIAGYLQSTSVSELYRRVFLRWEKDYGVELVRNTLALIAVCPRGIAEHDLRMMVAREDQPVESTEWSPFLISAENDLCPRPGFLALANEYISAAVLQGYLQPAEERVARNRAATIFGKTAALSVGFVLAPGIEERIPGLGEAVAQAETEISQWKARAYSQLPSQLSHLERWEDLSVVLRSRDYLNWALLHARADVTRYWSQLAAHLPGSATSLCEHVDLSSHTGLTRASGIADILAAIGEQKAAIDLLGGVCDLCRRERLWSPLAYALMRRAGIFRAMEDHDMALKALYEANSLFQSLEDEHGLAFTLTDQAVSLHRLDRNDEAIQKLETALRLLQKEGLQVPLAVVYNSLGSLLSKRGSLGRGLDYLRRAETIFREVGDLEELARTLNNRALALTLAWRFRDARACRKEAGRMLHDAAGNEALPHAHEEACQEPPVRWFRKILTRTFPSQSNGGE